MSCRSGRLLWEQHPVLLFTGVLVILLTIAARSTAIGGFRRNSCRSPHAQGGGGQ